MRMKRSWEPSRFNAELRSYSSPTDFVVKHARAVFKNVDGGHGRRESAGCPMPTPQAPPATREKKTRQRRGKDSEKTCKSFLNNEKKKGSVQREDVATLDIALRV
ncbi:unnamed protein product [Ixodes persulcatus]